jgi:hypothetical protein
MSNEPSSCIDGELVASGCALFPGVLAPTHVNGLIHALDDHAGQRFSRRGSDYAARNLLCGVPAISNLANSDPLMAIVRSAEGEKAFPVRGLLFDKVDGANWHVGWHQDVMIPVAERKEVEGFGSWSVKAGVMHVKPPEDVLANMIALRVHLDDCGPENGPLRVLPGSHRHGILSSEQVNEWIATRQAVTCTARRGDVLAMRLLLLHASSRAASCGHRRVIHIEYAAADLPGGLQWGVA